MTHTGYTQRMVALIRRPRVVVLAGGRLKTLGDINGPSDETVATCLGRMVNWWKLAEAVLETEFPNWGLLLQFTAFHVPMGLATNPNTRGQLQTLSNGFGLDLDNLVNEYEALCPLATQ